MAKPILVVRCNLVDAPLAYNKVLRALESKLHDYHVLLLSTHLQGKDEFLFETYNDISGLTDVDITQLLADIKNINNEE